MKNRRLAFMLLTLPIAFYAYACSSDDSGGDGTNNGEDGGPNPRVDSGGGGEDSGGQDSGGKDSGNDSGNDAGPTCVGNPLVADGGATPDGGVNLDAGVLRQIVATGTGFNDGPQWVDFSGGFLVYSDVYSKQVLKTGPDGGASTEIRATNNANVYPIGNAVRGDFILTVVSNDIGQPGGIFQTRIDGGAAGPTIDAGPSDNPNDLVVAPNGTIYISDPQYQNNPVKVEAVYRMAPDGGVTSIQTQNIFRPNGIALTADGKTLYVGQGPLPTDPAAGANRKILKFAVAADGTVTGPGATFVDAPLLADVPDGIAVDVGGNLWVAEAAGDGSESGRVEVFSPAGAKLGTIPFPNGRPTGVAFGGTDGKGLYITTEKAVYVYVSRCAGVK